MNIYNSFFKLWFKKLIVGFASTGGRNVTGHITAYKSAGGNKKRYRIIDFFRRINSAGFCLRVEKDPFRSTFISVNLYLNGLVGLNLATHSIASGSKIFTMTSEKYTYDSKFLNAGNTTILKYLPVGSLVYNIELYPFFGGQLARAAGLGALLFKKVGSKAHLKLKSG